MASHCFEMTLRLLPRSVMHRYGWFTRLCKGEGRFCICIDRCNWMKVEQIRWGESNCIFCVFFRSMEHVTLPKQTMQHEKNDTTCPKNVVLYCSIPLVCVSSPFSFMYQCCILAILHLMSELDALSLHSPYSFILHPPDRYVFSWCEKSPPVQFENAGVRGQSPFGRRMNKGDVVYCVLGDGTWFCHMNITCS